MYVSQVLIPHNLRNQASHWLRTLPDCVTSAANRWELDLGAPFNPGGYSSWVAPALDAQGRKRVLKVTANSTENRSQARLLKLLQGRGAVTLLDHFELDGMLVTLLDRLCPGTTLTDAKRDEEARDPVVAAVLRRVWNTDIAGESFPILAEQATSDVADLRQNPRKNLDPRLSVTAADVLERLVARSIDEVILGGDVHTDNILLSGDAWVLIDPEPKVGDRHHDLTTHILNCARLRTAPLALIERLARLAEVDPEILRQWVFVACVIAAEDWTDLVDVAPVLSP